MFEDGLSCVLVQFVSEAAYTTRVGTETAETTANVTAISRRRGKSTPHDKPS